MRAVVPYQMQLVEKHIIKASDCRFEPIDSAAFASKNLYNAANYIIRQEFIFNRRYIKYPELAWQTRQRCSIVVESAV